MTELVEIRSLGSLKPRRSHKRSRRYTTVAVSSESSDVSSGSDDSTPLLLNVPSKSFKTSRRHRTTRTLPIIVNNHSGREKPRHSRRHIQQFLIYTQPPPAPPSPKKEVVVQQIIQPPLTPEIQYVPVRAPVAHYRDFIDRRPVIYRGGLTPTLIEERPLAIYDRDLLPFRRSVRTEPSNTRNIHLPKHAEKLVNRFLSGMEYAHGYRFGDGSDSDCSIDDCRVCRRLRSAMGGRTRRSSSDLHLHHRDRLIVEMQDSHRHRHRHRHSHADDCEVCDLLKHSDVVISQRGDHSTSYIKKRGGHVHVVESAPPAKPKPTTETTTTTTTTTQPKVVINTAPVAAPAVPQQPSYYPMPYPTYTDPSQGYQYNYDPSWYYNSYGPGMTHDYSSYYRNPGYTQSYAPHTMHEPSVSTVTDTSLLPNHRQETIQTTTTVPSRPVVTEEIRTHHHIDRRSAKPTRTKLVVHRSPEDVAPTTSKVVIDQSHRSRAPRKRRSTRVVK